MDINYFICLLIIFAIGLLGYTHYEHLSNEVIYVKSSIDNNEYLVRNLKDKEIAANILAKLRMKLEKLCKIMKNRYPKDESVKRMNERFNSDNITESGKNNQYTSYSVNKGEKIVVCLRDKSTKKLVDENTIMFVILHEMSHLMTTTVGHTPEFWTNFRRVLQDGIQVGIYKQVNYSRSPTSYCGMTITDSPL
jgi:predicted metal-dependent hydrolase